MLKKRRTFRGRATEMTRRVERLRDRVRDRSRDRLERAETGCCNPVPNRSGNLDEFGEPSRSLPGSVSEGFWASLSRSGEGCAEGFRLRTRHLFHNLSGTGRADGGWQASSGTGQPFWKTPPNPSFRMQDKRTPPCFEVSPLTSRHSTTVHFNCKQGLEPRSLFGLFHRKRAWSRRISASYRKAGGIGALFSW